jgi:aspartate aminotransferase-like enzyme
MGMIEQFTAAAYSAIYRDLKDVVEVRSWSRDQSEFTRRPDLSELEIYSFPQTWGSTALGFDGIGGSAMTTALTVVVMHGVEACVYFGGSFAYRIEDINEAFRADMQRYDMKPVTGARKLYGKSSKTG